jgi:hypothetical protein
VADQQDAVFRIKYNPTHATADRLRQSLAKPQPGLPPSFGVKR